MAPVSDGPATATSHHDEIAAGARFGFGANWARFLEVLDDERIAAAERSLREFLGVANLDGKRFLDIGSGSGLFSLAARRLGADVTSFDYDPQSVACTAELRRRYFADDPRWRVSEGSVLDAAFLARLGTFDVVYSWGVLHHTGAMWDAITNAMARVAPGGQLFIALYNDQGRLSRGWLAVKQAYNANPAGRAAVLTAFVPYFVGRMMAGSALRGQAPWKVLRALRPRRGMSPMHDIIDWLGGLPFEVASPGQVHDFARDRGFTLERLHTVGGAHGCNEFVFRRAR